MNEYSYDLVAEYWSIYLGRELSDQDVAYLLTLFKLARYQRTDKEDHAHDLHKYAEQAHELHPKLGKAPGAGIGETPFSKNETLILFPEIETPIFKEGREYGED